MDSREIIFKILIDVNTNKAFSNISINSHVKKFNSRDENLIREIVYGVIENKKYIDYIISQVSTRPIKKIHPPILEILRIGVYQIVFMDKIPDRAAVNETVQLSKKYGHKGTVKYVNGILRNISRRKDDLIKVDKSNPINYLSIKYSYPKWMIKKWIGEYGYTMTEEVCKSGNKRPKLNIRVNTLKVNRNELASLLKSYDYKVEKTRYAKDGLVIENPVRITSLEEYKKGYFIIQDESSMLASQVLNPAEGSTVLDLCSAPGGKTTHMAQIMNNRGKIIARDIYDHKLDLVAKNATRLGIDIIEIESYDATNLDSKLIEKIDYCLVDAPCSGLGIIRRRPEIKWNRQEEDIESLVDFQWDILNKAKDYIRPKGFMVYSTCTISKSENENIVNRFLMENPNFKLTNINKEIFKDGKPYETKDRAIQLFPHIHDTDGFFIAKFQKVHG